MFLVMKFHQFAKKKHFRIRIFCCIFPGFKKQFVRRNLIKTYNNNNNKSPKISTIAYNMKGCLRLSKFIL
jgi:hypothetical protein